MVDVVDEARLAQLALTATASQLARMISGFRAADGMRLTQQNKRAVCWGEREDGMVEFRARLPKEEAAVMLAALNAAKDQFGPPPAQPDPCGDAEQEPVPDVGSYSNADALLDVARVFLATAPENRSGEDRTLVLVHVSAENLSRMPAEPVEASPSAPNPAENVPAGSASSSSGAMTEGMVVMG